MKQATLFLLALSLTFSLTAQQQRLKKGDVFTIKKSKFSQHLAEVRISKDYIKEIGLNQADKTQKQIEGMNITSSTYKILDVLDDHYRIQFSDSLIFSYERGKYLQSKQWKTIKSQLYQTIPCQSNRDEKNSFTIPDLNDVKFDLSFTGEISNIVTKDSLQSINPEMEKKIKSILKRKFHFPVTEIPYTFHSGEKIKINDEEFIISEITESYISIYNESISDSIHKRNEYKIDPITGLILENQSYLKGNNFTTNTRQVLIANTPKNNDCIFKKNDIKEDSTQLKTNVIIKGKILNPKNNMKVQVTWNEKLPGGINRYNNYKAITHLKSDNTFELKLYIDRIQKIRFVHNESSSFYVMPGDDIYLTVDLNQFNKTIEAKGVGSNHVNYYLKSFLYEEMENFKWNTINLNRQDMKELSFKEYKQQVDHIINKKTDFLKTYEDKISPEVYLASYYEIVNKGVESLMYYGMIHHFENIDNIALPKEYTDLELMVHPDNDLMSFYDGYEFFITKYVFNFLDTKVENMMGKSNISYASTNDRISFDEYANYGYTSRFFNGYSQYILKYQSVSDAIEMGNRDIYSQLYNRFINEYPSSDKAKQLTEAYLLAENSREGKPAYNFEMDDIKGNKVKLSDFKGKVVYLSILTTYDEGYIKDVLNAQDSIQKLFGSKDFQFLYVLMKKGPNVTEVANELNKNSIALLLKDQDLKLLFDNYLFCRLPYSFIIDKNGIIEKRDAPDPLQLLEQPNNLLDVLKAKKKIVDPAYTIRILKVTLIISGVILIFALIIWILYRRNTQRKIKASAVETKIRELELTAIRAQMNPHFMYNCLNSIQNLVQKKQTDEAHQYLSKFASLIRSVLNNSDKEEISLSTELEIINKYVELEKLRFNINYHVKADENIDGYSIFIPPLILQPLVENAILHGLVPKQGERNLAINIFRNKPYKICVSIIDDGVGRTNYDKKSSSNGKGIHFSRERLKILSEKYGTDYSMEITDLQNPTGTKVEICFSEE